MRMQALGSSYSMVKDWIVLIQQERVYDIGLNYKNFFGTNSDAFVNSTDNGAKLVTDDTSAS